MKSYACQLRGLCSLLLAGLLWLSAASPANASGFGIFTQGAAALGLADAVVAQGDDASAVFFNPAQLNRLSGSRIKLGTTLIFPQRDYTNSVSGQSAGSQDDFYTPSSLFISHPIDERLAAGFGIFNPFGLGTEWSESWEGRYLATKSEIQTFNFNPSLSWQVHPRLSLAAGVSYLILDADLQRMINPALFGLPLLPDPRQQFTGDGDGWGYNLGLLWSLSDRIALGLAYRSEINVAIDGRVRFDLPTPALAALLPNANGRANLRLPQQLFAGLQLQLTEQLSSEIGLRWEGWSSFQTLRIDLDRPVAGSTFINEPKDWQDTYAFNLGLAYRLNDRIRLLGGYLYGESPVPDSTFDPAIPDSDTHLFTLGTSLAFAAWRLDLGYGLQLQDERRKNNSVGAISGSPANGEYEALLHLLAIDLSYKF